MTYVHESAEVHLKAVLYMNAWVGAGAKVWENCVVGEGSWVGPGSILRDGCVLQKYVTVLPGASLEPGTHVKQNTTVHTGQIGGYIWNSWRDPKRGLMLQLGCEARALSYWRKHLVKLCREHREMRMLKSIRGLVTKLMEDPS